MSSDGPAAGPSDAEWGGPDPRVSQQASASGFAQIFMAGRDLIVFEAEAPYRIANWPSRPAMPSPREMREQPSVLLRAGNGLIEFTGRDSEVEELREWRDSPVQPRLAVRLIHGPGGQGKTRLAGHVADTWHKQRWVVLAAYHRRDRSVPGSFTTPDLEGAAGVLVVVDYAERWDTSDLLSLLRDTTIPTDLPVRVLLLARPAGTWWQSLEGRIQRDVQLIPGRHELRPLEEDKATSRTELFAVARDRFAELLNVSDVQAIDPPDALGWHYAYQLVLTVHMAALAAVLAHDQKTPSPVDPAEVSAFLLARERDHWEAMNDPRREKPLATKPDAMGQAVYTATLTGPLSREDGIAALHQIGVESAEHPGQILKDHAACYPPFDPGIAGPGHHDGTGTVLEPLYPDRLGEDFLALTTPGHSHEYYPADLWAGTAPARLLALAGAGGPAQVWTRPALTILIETARRWPHIATGQLRPLLLRHPQAALAAGGTALARLADIDGLDLPVLQAVEALLPDGRDPDLDVGIAAFTRSLLPRLLADTTDHGQRAKIYFTASSRYFRAGLWELAVEALGHVEAILDEVETMLPAPTTAEVAAARDMLADMRAACEVELGRTSRAYAKLRQRADEPTTGAPLPDEPDTAERLRAGRLAVRLATEARLGLWTRALATGQEAVELHRRLVASGAREFVPSLAEVLANFGGVLAAAGRTQEALGITVEAVELLRPPAQANPGESAHSLADALNNLSNRLSDLGRWQEAFDASAESVEILRPLAGANPGAFAQALGRSLSNLGICQSAAGQLREALDTEQEAVQIRRHLAEQNPAAYEPDLADSLNNLSIRLSKLRQHEEAMHTAAEAVKIRRRLAATNRAASEPGLATSLRNLGVLLWALGRREEALAVTSESAGIRRHLAQQNPAAYEPGLAKSLNDLGFYLSGLGRGNDALVAVEESLALYRELVARRPREFADQLRNALDTQAGILEGLGRIDEAARIRHQLGTEPGLT